jgi:hypothetical protein
VGEYSEVRTRRRFVAALLLLLGLATVIRLPLVREGLWRDEALGAFIAQSPSLHVFLERSRISDYNPPLFNGLIATWGAIAGFQERSLKTFALLWGLAAIGGVAILGGQLFGPAGGLISAMLASNNPILIELSAELRPYSLSVFLATLCLTLILRLRLRPPVRYFDVRSIALAFCLALLAYSHLAGLLVAAVVGIVGLLVASLRRMRRFGIAVAGSASLAGIAFLPWLPTSLRQARIGLPWEVALSPAAKGALLFHRLHEVVPSGGVVTPLVGTVVIGCAVAATHRDIRERFRAASFGCAVTAACALSVLLVLSFYSPSPRYLVIPAALFAVLLGGVLGIVWDSLKPSRPAIRVLGTAGVGLLLAASISARIPLYLEMFERDRVGLPKSGVRSLCREYDLTRDNLVVVAPDYLALTVWYYCKPAASLHSFVRWDNPYLFDPRDYRALWVSHVAVPETLRHVARALDANRAGGFKLIWDTWSNGPPLFYLRRIDEFRRALSERYSVARPSLYAGRVERVGFAEYRGDMAGPIIARSARRPGP